MNRNEIVGLRLRDAMWENRISSAELARRVGVDRGWVWRRADGRVPITVDDLARIADALAVAPVDLLPDSWRQPSAATVTRSA